MASAKAEMVPVVWVCVPRVSGGCVGALIVQLSLLAQALIRIDSGSADIERVTLPRLLARLSTGEALDFPMLRPHQRPAWHAFLVQLAVLALEEAGQTLPPTDEAVWRELLQGLTPDHPDGEPWCLVVDDWQQPAFMQAPCLPGAEGDYKRVLHSAQEIDLLITGKNHDEKVGKMSSIGEDDANIALFSLVSVQGFTGFLGAGNFGSMRMNGGFGSRAQFRLVFKRGWGAEFLRDVLALLTQLELLWDEANSVPQIGTKTAHALLWLMPWDTQALSLDSIHPLCLEVSRRIRFRLKEGYLEAMTAGSTSARVAAKDRYGVVLDPWLPVIKEGSPIRALTASASTLSYRLLSPLLFDSKRCDLPRLAHPAPGESGAAVMLVQVLVGGSGKTDGCLRREIRMPARTLRKFADVRSELALRATLFIEMAAVLQGKVLRAALLQFIDGSAEPDWKNGDFGKYVGPWIDRFEHQVDDVFYDQLFATIEAGLADVPAQTQWLSTLLPLARSIFDAATEALPTRDRSRLFAQARAMRMFNGGLYKHLGTLLPARPDPPEADGASTTAVEPETTHVEQP